MLVILTTPEPAARDTFAEAVRCAVRGDVIDVKIAASDLSGSAPWVALVPDRLGRGVYRFIDQLRLADRGKVWPASMWENEPASPPPEPALVEAIAPWVSSSYNPPLASPEPPHRRSRLLVMLLAGVVVVLLGGTAAVWLLRPGPTPTAAGNSGKTGSGSPTPHPSFRSSATPMTVLGDNWEPGDATKIQAFGDWPFAFRTPADATCTFYVDEPAYKAINCEWGTGAKHTIMAYVVRRCANGCDAAERTKFESMTPWKPDTTLSDKDATTRFGEVNYGGGREQFTMLHYFAVPPGDGPQWVTIVQGNCPLEDRELVLKTMNDIRSQTP